MILNDINTKSFNRHINNAEQRPIISDYTYHYYY